MLSGWVTVDGVEYYFDKQGRLLTDGVTPDGFIVNEFGVKVGYNTGVQAQAGTDIGQGRVASPIASLRFLPYYQQLMAKKYAEALLAQQQALTK